MVSSMASTASDHDMKMSSSSVWSQVALVYVVAAAAACYVFHVLSQQSLSGLITLAALAQCLSWVLLVMQVCNNHSASGISARGLGLNAMALALRLSNTCWLNGYLPIDASGDYFYQLTDIFSLLLICWLLYQVLYAKRETYNKDEDSFPALPVAIWSLVLGMVFHADLNQRPVFDSLWMASIFVNTFAACPQLHIFAQVGGSDQALTIHHVAAMGISWLLCGVFLFFQREEITCQPWISGINHAQLSVSGMHVLQCLLMGDFGYFYVTSMMRDGFNMELKLEGSQFV